MNRSETKQLMRAATRERIRLERQAFGARRIRFEEVDALIHLKGVPSVFAIAEKLNRYYRRPLWASERYGAR